MATKELNTKNARFDTRLPKEQKVFFERAAQLGGYRNLTEFVVITVQEKAKEIISESHYYSLLLDLGMNGDEIEKLENGEE